MNTAVLLYSDAKKEYFLSEQQFIAEAEVEGRAYVIGKYLEKLGFKIEVLPADDCFIEKVKLINPVVVFNLADSIRGLETLCSAVPAALEIINIPYTGTGQLGLALSSNKFLTNTLLEQAKVPVPKYQLFSDHTDALDERISYPVISKLNSIHGSIEINQSAISKNAKELKARLKYLIKTYNDDVLVSEYIEGEEIAAILVEGIHKKVYTGKKVLGKKWAKREFQILDFDVVWGDEPNRFHYEKVDSTNKLKDLVKKAYSALKIEDYAKFDIRVDKNGNFYFIDANANCALGPKETECDIGMILDMYGVRFEEILRRLILNTLNGTTPEFIKKPFRISKQKEVVTI